MADSLLGNVVERVQEVTGIAVTSTERMSSLRESEYEAGRWRNEAEDLAIRTMDYFGGRPQEMLPERRKRIAQRARIAFYTDPLGGRDVEMTADFVLGKGIPKPTARAKQVQRIIDELWKDPVNEDNLFSYDAQRAIVNDLKTQANMFVLMFTGAGKVRFDFLDHDAVNDVVTDEEARRRALYYVAEERRYAWDFDQDRPALNPQWEDGKLKIRYYEHWRNVDVAVEEREERGEEPVKKAPDAKLGKGKVMHVRANRLGESHFGIPQFNRSLRFLSAMNQFVESRVAMSQAQASFIARRVVKGTPRQVMKQAGRVLSQVGELGSARFANDGGGIAGGRRNPDQPPAQGPVSPGSFLYENEGMETKPLSLSSGASDATANAQVIRGQFSAASGYGQHLLGDASNANLATATTLELPVMMMISAWQKLLLDFYTWTVDRAIEEAVRAGRLGGTGTTPGDRKLAEFRLYEADSVADFEDERGIDLSYTFQMPFPGRRDPVATGQLVTESLLSFDPDGTNIPLRRALLTYLLQQGFEMPDADNVVNEALPEAPKGGQPPQPFKNAIPPALAMLLGLGQPGGAAAPGRAAPPPNVNPSQYGEARQPSQPGDVRGLIRAELVELFANAGEDGATVAAFVPEEIRSDVAAYANATDDVFDAEVTGPARAAASRNGDGG